MDGFSAGVVVDSGGLTGVGGVVDSGGLTGAGGVVFYSYSG